MTTARTVPVTTEMDGDELDAEDAWHLRATTGCGTSRSVRSSVSGTATGSPTAGHWPSRPASRWCRSCSPSPELAADLDQDRPARVLARTIEAVSPGAGNNDALASAVTGPQSSEQAGEIALTLGLILSFVSMITAMAQVERGANRIYGIRRDRPRRRSTAARRC